MRIAIGRARVNRTLGVLFVGLTAAGIAAEIARNLFRVENWLVDAFSLSFESNVPSWYSSVVLLACAAVLSIIALDARRSRARFRFRWTALAVIFLYLSIDEAVQIHENLNTLFAVKGLYFFFWVIPGGIAVAVLAVVYAPLWRHLPAGIRPKVALGAATYVAGALGVEILLGYWADVHGDANLGYALLDVIEESLEILGMSIFLSALLDHLRGAVAEVRLAFVAPPAPRPPDDSRNRGSR